MALITNCDAYWKFDINSGSQVDSTGNGNTLTVNGAVFTSSGIINSAYDYNGLSDYLTYSSSFQTSSSFSWAVWAKSEIAGSSYTVLAGIMGNFGSSSNEGILMRVHTPTDKVRVIDGNGTIQLEATNTLDTNWHHYVITYDGTNVRFYVDGSLNDTSGSITLSDTTTVFQLGRDSLNSGRYFNGIIDECGIWSRELSSTEISELYNSGSGLQYPFTVGEDNNAIFFGNNF